MPKEIQISSQQLEELEMLSMIATRASNSILLLDCEGNILWANKGFENLYGYDYVNHKTRLKEENAGFIKILRDTDKKFLITNNSLSFTHSFLNSLGRRKWVQTTLTPLVKDNEIEKYIAIEVDITQQKEVEEELIQQQENTQTLSEHLESVKDYIEDQIEQLNQQKQALKEAKDKSEDVLSKVIPYEVAIQLKKKGYAAPRHYKKVTVMHFNIRNFLSLTQKISIEEMIGQLHDCFVSIDNILESHYVEKIKTIGGLYIGAGGVPLRNRSNPIDVALAALKIRQFILELNVQHIQSKLPPFETGIGIHTGKAIAGVVGKNRISYDIWGETVNTSANFENLAPMGDIILSDDSYQEIKEFFNCSPFEQKKEDKLWILNGIKPEYAKDSEGIHAGDNLLRLLSKL